MSWLEQALMLCRSKTDGILQLFIDQSCHLNTDAARYRLAVTQLLALFVLCVNDALLMQVGAVRGRGTTESTPCRDASEN